MILAGSRSPAKRDGIYPGAHRPSSVTSARVRPPSATAAELAAWRMTIPPGHRFEATEALRQTLARAVSWGVLNANPAKQGVENPQRARRGNGYSNPGRRSLASRRESGRATGRWSCSPQLPG
jgi:hypothetical protein